MTARRGSFGPVQLARHLGWWDFQVARAVRHGLIPAPDLGSRWSAGLVETFAARAGQLGAEVGSLPDMGAARAARVLAERFGCEVTPDAVFELARRGVLPVVNFYRANPLFDGGEVERFSDRAVLDDAAAAGRCVTADEAAEHLRIRRSDFGHLVRAGRVGAVRRVYGSYRRSRSAAPLVALFRVVDLDALLADAGIDWAAVRATAPGRRSPLAALPTATTTNDDETQEVQ
ncbi:hypothetical protein [Kribbella italica]|uniref:DNA-binding protein n=1 Tax=Kribbella italica TaxID=1540520 RepID=A0A7W9JDM9_9ACTN|nr:hypothetical protein [Kribbella italica]MBB5840188.1 hypothetical protein [Kribbella italica]